jgi:hypothetical protein
MPNQNGPGVSPPASSITQLNVKATVGRAITEQQDTQTIFIYVRDQQQRPVEGANASAVLRFQSQDQFCEPDTPTDGNGFTHCSCEILPSPFGQKVIVDVSVTYGELAATTQTFFLPWR